MRDSPGAASALGLGLVRTKFIVFGVSAAMAGLAGCFYTGLQQQAGGSEFTYFISLSALLILAIQGLTAVPGAVLGGIFYAFLYLLVPQWISNTNVVNAIQPLGIGGAVFAILSHPEGVWLQQSEGVKRLLKALRRKRTAQAEKNATPLGPMDHELVTTSGGGSN
jgi:ABC-type branched-subunit amino acid transport system permease subunit